MNKRVPESYNYKNSIVAKDNIWKDYVKKANAQAKEWPQMWGDVFLNQTPVPSSTVPSAHHKTIDNIQAINTNTVNSPRSMPKTTSSMIGWISTNPINRLEKYGPYTKGRYTITSQFGWPKEGVN